MGFFDRKPGLWLGLLLAAPLGFVSLLAAACLFLPGCIPLPAETVASSAVGIGGSLFARRCPYELVARSQPCASEAPE